MKKLEVKQEDQNWLKNNDVHKSWGRRKEFQFYTDYTQNVSHVVSNIKQGKT